MTGKLSIFLLTITFIAVSLQDFYDFNQGLPIFSLVGTSLYLIIVTGWLVLERPQESPVRGLSLILLFALIALTLWSTALVPLRGIKLQVKTPLGFLFGQTCLWVTLMATSRPTFRGRLLLSFNYLTYFHLTAFLLQVFYFLVSGDYLDWVQIFTGEPSRYNPGNIIPMPRFTGLFVEPAHCAGFFFMLCVVRLNHNGFNNDRVVSLLVTSMVATLSVLGFFALVALITFITLRSRRKLGLFMGAIALMIVGGIIWSQPDIQEYLSGRISDPLEDASGQARLINGFLDFVSLSSDKFYLGYGLGNSELIGSVNEVLSGYIYILFYFGLFGGLVFYALVFGMLAASHVAIPTMALVVVTFLAKPSFTWSFWWIWIALLCVYRFSKTGTIAVSPTQSVHYSLRTS